MRATQAVPARRLFLVTPKVSGHGRSGSAARDNRLATATKLPLRPGVFPQAYKVDQAAAVITASGRHGSSGKAESASTPGKPAGRRTPRTNGSIKSTGARPTKPESAVSTPAPAASPQKAHVASQKPTAGKGRKGSSQEVSGASKAKPAVKGEPTKKDAILALLRRKQGATLKELMEVTRWQSHSVRGFLSGTLHNKMGIKVRSGKGADGERVYSVRS